MPLHRRLSSSRRDSPALVHSLLSRSADVALLNGVVDGDSWAARLAQTGSGKRRGRRTPAAKRKRGKVSNRLEPGRGVVQRVVRALFETDEYVAACRSKLRTKTNGGPQGEMSARGIEGEPVESRSAMSAD